MVLHEMSSALPARWGHVQSLHFHPLCMTQEYLGSYISDVSGRLVFREGALVRAVRHGQWLVLDELNLAPSDVLEALNRWAGVFYLYTRAAWPHRAPACLKHCLFELEAAAFKSHFGVRGQWVEAMRGDTLKCKSYPAAQKNHWVNTSFSKSTHFKLHTPIPSCAPRALMKLQSHHLEYPFCAYDILYGVVQLYVMKAAYPSHLAECPPIFLYTSWPHVLRAWLHRAGCWMITGSCLCPS